MRLLITPAAASPTGAWEKASEVVRVERHGAGFGVAVVFSKHSTVPNGHLQSGQPDKRERRCTQRQPFIATTEVIDVRTGGRSWARTADLSMSGCYIDTLNPFPLDTIVRLRIQKESATVELCSRVISCHPRSGMGLVFEGITPAQRATLAKWLLKESAGLESVSAASPPTEATKENCEDQPRFARLLDILTRKGVLSKRKLLLRYPPSLHVRTFVFCPWQEGFRANAGRMANHLYSVGIFWQADEPHGPRHRGR